MLIGAIKPSWITSVLHAFAIVALITPIANKKASRFDSIFLFKNGPIKTIIKITESPMASMLFPGSRFYDIARRKKQCRCRFSPFEQRIALACFSRGKYPRNLSRALIRWGKFILRGRRHGVKRQVQERFCDYYFVRDAQRTGVLCP